jgi:hypothetical protein
MDVALPKNHTSGAFYVVILHRGGRYPAKTMHAFEIHGIKQSLS